MCDHSGRVVQIEQHGTQAIGSHGADTVGDDEPAMFRFEGRSGISDLDKLPGVLRSQDSPGAVPERDLL